MRRPQSGSCSSSGTEAGLLAALLHVGQDLIPDAVRREAVAGLAGIVGVEGLANRVGELVARHLVDVDRHLAEEAFVAGVAVGLGESGEAAGGECGGESSECKLLHGGLLLFNWAASSPLWVLRSAVDGEATGGPKRSEMPFESGFDSRRLSSSAAFASTERRKMRCV